MQPPNSPPTIPLPVPTVSGAAQCDLYIATTTIDNRGRLSNRSPIRFLGWRSRQRIRLDLTAGTNILLTAESDPNGNRTIDPRGYLRLSAENCWCARIRTADRLLTIADRRRNRLVVYPPTVLSDLLLSATPEAWGNHGQY